MCVIQFSAVPFLCQAVMVIGSAVLLAAALVNGLQASPDARLSPQTLRAIDAYFRAEVPRSGFPGGSLAIVQGDKTVLVSTTGVSDLESQAKVTEDTVYCIGSMTKPFTATAILQLRDAGKLELDQPVTRYLPRFRVAEPGAAEHITIRELLTHTSGLPTNSHSVVWEDEASIRGSIERAVRGLHSVHLSHPPGTQFEYANMNYVVLGRVIEAVSGESWSAYVTRHIFAPLGMTHSATSQSTVDPKALARAYWPQFGRLAIGLLQVGDFMAPASNILTSAPDLARFAAAHLGTGEPILTPASFAEAHLGEAEMPTGARYALGWVNERFRGVTVFHHGGAAGHSTAVYLVPERQLAIVVLLGAYSHVENERIAQGVLSLALGARPLPTEGLSELSVLTWTSRAFVGLTLACPVTLAILPLLRRRRWRRWATRRY
ncbi:MAG TPA: serine hydrolase domain-containing protein, partial [Polyangiaceae bacterium]|nr:serine hydrolase domain-containing protein [Polyangiaceae bacterium]